RDGECGEEGQKQPALHCRLLPSRGTNEPAVVLPPRPWAKTNTRLATAAHALSLAAGSSPRLEGRAAIECRALPSAPGPTQPAPRARRGQVAVAAAHPATVRPYKLGGGLVEARCRLLPIRRRRRRGSHIASRPGGLATRHPWAPPSTLTSGPVDGKRHGVQSSPPGQSVAAAARRN